MGLLLLLKKHSRSVLRRFIEGGLNFCFLSDDLSAEALAKAEASAKENSKGGFNKKLLSQNLLYFPKISLPDCISIEYFNNRRRENRQKK
jgi:hypothetical protein